MVVTAFLAKDVTFLKMVNEFTKKVLKFGAMFLLRCRSAHQCDCLRWWKLFRKVFEGRPEYRSEEKERHDIAMEKYQAVFEKYKAN